MLNEHDLTDFGAIGDTPERPLEPITISGNSVGTAPSPQSLAVVQEITDVLRHQLEVLQTLSKALKPGDVEVGMHIQINR